MKIIQSLALVAALILSQTVTASGQNTNSHAHVVLVKGADGDAEFGDQFKAWVGDWEKIAKTTGVTLTLIGTESSDTKDIDQLEKVITQNKKGTTPLWIVMIGHGTFSGKQAKFNLRGRDISAQQLSKWLDGVQRPIAIVNCASCSAPFINQLSGKNRVVVTATRNGNEFNFSRFGGYFTKAIASPDSDLDHDDEVSIHEAFLRASAEVGQFYEAEARLQSEHALIDDNGDGRGTPANMFRGVRPIGKAKDGASLDGRVAKDFGLSTSNNKIRLNEDEIAQRRKIEQQVEALRASKGTVTEAEHDAKLEPLLIRLAKIYQAAEKRSLEK